jgi:AcrR family transcriptional regulator
MSTAPDQTSRFQQKREQILDAASALINENGVKGMTFVEVAERVNLNTTSVTYYFKRKELLAAAALQHSLARLEAQVDEAGSRADPRARVSAYLDLHFDLRARIRRREERPITHLSDMRALEEPLRSDLAERWSAIFRKVRDFFGPSLSEQQKRLNTARANVLIENMFWLPAWLPRYSTADFGRVRHRLFEIFERGIGAGEAPWQPSMLTINQRGEDPAQENFLRAATRLINVRGYRGASVERIASELNVTKGSFYHHLEAKDDLVLQCFRRSYERVSLVQAAADEAGGTHWQRLTSAMVTLLHFQFFGEHPLLRTAALQALPSDLRSQVVDRSNRMARRFAGTMIDGITEGSVRPIDPLVASQAIMAMLNAAVDLQKWARGSGPERAIAEYASTLCYGLFSDPPG